MFTTIGLIVLAAVILTIVAGILISFYFTKKEEYHEHVERKSKKEKPTGGRPEGQQV